MYIRVRLRIGIGLLRSLLLKRGMGICMSKRKESEI